MLVDPTFGLQSLGTMARALAVSMPMNALLECAAEEALHALKAASVSIGRLEPDWLRTLVNVGDLAPSEVRWPQDEVYYFAEWDGTAARVITDGITRVDHLGTANCHPKEAELLDKLGKESSVTAAISVDGTIWGEFYATRQPGMEPFAEQAVDYVDALTSIMGAAISRTLREATLEHVASHDPLTNALNRRGFAQAAAHVFDLPEGTSRVVTVVALDINGLKQVNDQQGHSRGDELIQAVARVLHEAFASYPGSLVARVGGDEFAVLVPHHEPTRVARTVEALCQRAGQEGSFGPAAGLSAGASSALLTGRGDVTRDELLTAADQALYEAKRQPLSAVVVSEDYALNRRGGRRAEDQTGKLTVAPGLRVGMLGGSANWTMGAMRVLTPESSAALGPLSGFLAGSDSVGAAMVERDGTIVEANGALERLAGSVVSFHEVVVPAQCAIVTDLLTGAGPGWSSVQAGLVRGSGEAVDCKIWAQTCGEGILVLAEPLLTPMENLNDLLLELNDELFGARRELGAKNRRLRELDELKNMFLASSAHDLKTPLTSILGYAELLGEVGLPTDAQGMALTIENSAHRLLTMINDLLGAASIMTGELKLERSRTDLMTVVSDAVQEIRPAARAGQVAISWSGTGSADAVVDERRVRQVLDNLLSNAVKYCPGGGQVTVSCQVRGPKVVVTVADTGIGIPAAEQKQLFGRYFRASTAVGCGIEGTGLGLANARAFAEAHGGSLTCASEPGAGSTFTLVLPDGVVAA